MTGRTHDLAAITTLAGFVLVQPIRSLSLATFILALIANQIGGVAPDIDQPTAPLWRNLPIGGIFGKLFGKLIGGHRFITHSLIGVALFGYLSMLILHVLHPLIPHANTGLITGAFVIGMLSHLVMDSFTKEGVPWLLPIPVRFGFPPLKKLRITTGKKFEMLVIFPSLIVVNIWIYSTHYYRIIALLKHHIQ